MNYADFGVSGPDELEQDEWSLHGGEDGGRPTFETPKGGVLTVLGFHRPPKGQDKEYILVCSLCSEKTAIFGDGVFKSQRYKLKAGVICCGCSKRHVKSIAQMLEECSSASPEGVEIRGYVPPLSGVNTRLKCFCERHGEWTSTTVRKFLAGNGCPSCKGYKMWEKRRLERDFHGEANKACKSKGVTFIKMVDEKRVTEGIVVECPLHGRYVTSIAQVKSPSKGNGCLACKKVSASERSSLPDEYHIRKYESLGVFPAGSGFRRLESKTKSGQMWLFTCPLCGESAAASSSNLGDGKIPCSCGKNRQMQTYLLVITDQGLPVSLKLGKARVWHKRVKALNKRNLFKAVCIGAWEYPSVKSCSLAERECKQALQTGVLSAREMEDGHTETVSVLDLEKVIAIYEKHGGVRIK